jgi:hypothetical protein
MRKEEIMAIAENIAQYFPERMSGSESSEILVKCMADLVQTERLAVIESLRDWIALRIPQSQRKPGDGKREFWMWFALDIVEKYRMTKLLTYNKAA